MDKALENSKQLKRASSSSQIFFQSLKFLKPEKNNIIRKVIFIIIEISIAIIMSKQENTISMTKEISQLLGTIVLALIAIVFTVYSFLQALISDKLLVVLLSVDDEKGNLYGTNKYFAEVMIFLIGCLLLDTVITIFMIVVPSGWDFFAKKTTSEIIAVLLLTVLLHCNFEGMWEMKSFAYNVFQLYNLHAYERTINIKEREQKNS